MVPATPPCRGSEKARGRVRHRRVPQRVFGTKLVVARPRDGAALVLDVTAAHVWRQLDDWTTLAEIDRFLAETFPDVAEQDRVTARSQIVGMLEDEDLVERA